MYCLQGMQLGGAWSFALTLDIDVPLFPNLLHQNIPAHSKVLRQVTAIDWEGKYLNISDPSIDLKNAACKHAVWSEDRYNQMTGAETLTSTLLFWLFSSAAAQECSCGLQAHYPLENVMCAQEI